MSSISVDLEKEDILLQVRDKLRQDNVNLWLQPFYHEASATSSQEDMLKLAETYCVQLKISLENCYEAIVDLQNTALEKLKQNKHFQQSGIATLKFKVLHPNSPSRIFRKELLLSLRGSDIKDMISQETNTTKDKLKLIHVGKVLNDSESLSGQDVKNGQQILCIILSDLSPDMKKAEEQIRELEGVKTDSRLLALDSDYMQLEDQFGNLVKIPEEEKRAIIVAIALHEKGRTALKREDFARALVFFLEADAEFRCCNSQLLNSVDNYALLDLDIAWCYLCLKSIENLPEAYVRLKRCEERFHASYGPSFERLIAVKGEVGNEAVLFMRLHLLQAIALYHKNKRKESLEMLKRAQMELNKLKVNDNSIAALVNLGYTIAEARLGLRVNDGQLNRAANYIDENRKKRSESRKRALAEEVLEKKRKKLGFCIDGQQYVNPNFVNLLVNMGFSHETACTALRNTNNAISESIQYIQENPQPGPSRSRDDAGLLDLINSLIPELVAAGFDANMAKLALEKCDADIMKAADMLMSNNGIIDGKCGDDAVKSTSEKSVDLKNEKVEEDKEAKEAKNNAFKRVAEDISMVDDDHLDSALVQEEMFLNQYLPILENQ